MTIESPFPSPIVDSRWLAHHRGDVTLADVRWSIPTGPKTEDFAQQHIPGAVFVDLDADLSDPPGNRGRHPLPTVAAFRTAMLRLDLWERPVVCYDDTSGATASRLWWMLTALGRPAAVLDGGIASWPGPWEQGLSTRSGRGGAKESAPAGSNDGSGSTEEWPADLLIDVDSLLTAIERGQPLLDARSHERFLGQPNRIDPTPGHVPGAGSRPWTENIDTDGKLRSAEDLRRQFNALGVEESTEWLASCGSGVTACHNILSAVVAGLPRGRLYPGSWSEWIRDSSRPVETGEG